MLLEAKTVGGGGSGRTSGELTVWNRNHYSALLSLYDAATVIQIARSYDLAKKAVEKVGCSN